MRRISDPVNNLLDKLKFIFTIMLFFAGNQMNAAQNLPSKTELDALMRENKVPGLSFVIIENAEITSHMELGVKNAQKKI